MLKISNICCIVDFKWLMYVYISIKLNYPSITFLDYCDKTKINIYVQVMKNGITLNNGSC